MKNLLIALFLITNVLAFSQKKDKVKIKMDRKNDQVIVDGVPFFSYENKAGGGLEIFNMNDESIAYFDLTCYQDYMAVSESNPKGNVCYKTIHFEGIEEQTEISGLTVKGIAKLLMDHNIFKDGVLNIEETKKFIKRNGNKHSAEQLK